PLPLDDRVNAPGDGGVEPTLRDRLSGLSRAELGGLVALVAITLGGAGLWYARSLPRPVEVRAATALPAPATSATSSPDVVPILVDVSGIGEVTLEDIRDLVTVWAPGSCRSPARRSGPASWSARLSGIECRCGHGCWPERSRSGRP